VHLSKENRELGQMKPTPRNHFVLYDVMRNGKSLCRTSVFSKDEARAAESTRFEHRSYLLDLGGFIRKPAENLY
jgi:hypothetical protein